MRKEIVNKQADFFISKFTIWATIQFVLFIVWIPFVVLANQSFVDYGWAVNVNEIAPLPVIDQCYRLWLLLFSSLILVISIYLFYLSIEFFRQSREWFLIIGFGVLSWIYLIYLYMRWHQTNFMSTYYYYLRFDLQINQQVSFRHLLDMRWDRLTRNTLLYIFSFIILFIGFIFILIPNLDDNYLDRTFIYNSLSYFTHLTNMGCLFWLIIFLFNQTKRINQNNTMSIFMGSYLLVVALTYWVALFPNDIIDGDFARKSVQLKTEAIWLHTITPIFFVWFIINTFCINRQPPNNRFFKTSLSLLIYPLWYFSYAYSIPFMVRESVYGQLSNINPDGYIWSPAGFIKNGEPYFVLSILAFGLAFELFFILLRFINIKIVKNNNWYKTHYEIY